MAQRIFPIQCLHEGFRKHPTHLSTTMKTGSFINKLHKSLALHCPVSTNKTLNWRKGLCFNPAQRNRSTFKSRLTMWCLLNVVYDIKGALLKICVCRRIYSYLRFPYVYVDKYLGVNYKILPLLRKVKLNSIS